MSNFSYTLRQRILCDYNRKNESIERKTHSYVCIERVSRHPSIIDCGKIFIIHVISNNM